MPPLSTVRPKGFPRGLFRPARRANESDRNDVALDPAGQVSDVLSKDARQTMARILASPEMLRLTTSVDAEFAIAGADGPIQLMVAGGSTGEGCTETALGIALSAAALDDRRRVLLIDASDGAAARALWVAGDQPGFSEMMVEGSNLSLVDMITSTAMPNLHVLARGDGRHWRAQSRPLERLLAQARSRFDLIVIDAPALLDDPRTLLLAKQAGHVLLVVRKAGLASTELAAAIEDMRRAGATIIGCAMTSRRRRSASV